MVEDRTRAEVNARLGLDYLKTLHDYMTRVEDNYEIFVEDKMAQDACITQINNLSQCMNRMRDHSPDIYLKAFPERHRKGLTGMRTILIHDYENRDPKYIWRFIHNDAPALELIFNSILSGDYDKNRSLAIKPKKSLLKRF